MIRRLLAALVVSALPLFGPGCGGGAAQMPPSMQSPIAGKPLPDFKRRTLEGAEVDTKGLRGRVVVVKFFAKYCEPCKRTLPAVQALSKDRQDITFIGIAEDEREVDVREMIGAYGLTFPVIHDRGNVLSGRYRVSEMPVTFVVDAQGTIRWVGGPEQSEVELEQAILAVAP
ncbi:MAG TPA: TlpA disulfide reductase family protein [Candidatus Nanopelagicales bacterium]|nr:TlpA disulfide reductase family protein [Candidatus Nanopelagicales bacterium]